MHSQDNVDQILSRELEIENSLLMQNMKNLKNKMLEKDNKIKELEIENNVLKNNTLIMQQDFYKLQEEYNKIIYSRTYKITKKIIKIIKGK